MSRTCAHKRLSTVSERAVGDSKIQKVRFCLEEYSPCRYRAQVIWKFKPLNTDNPKLENFCMSNKIISNRKKIFDISALSQQCDFV